MPFHRLYYHIVWATFRRTPMIVEGIRPHVFKAITDKCDSLGATVLAIGGVDDHMHLAVSLPPVIAVSEFIGGVKGASAYHVNHFPDSEHRLEWQRGYGALSFGRDHLDRVIAYINNQQDHHGAGRLWGSLEECGEDDDRKPMVVREGHAEYDPFSL